jgi:tetratricopeptide (TPR) repeat protein
MAKISKPPSSQLPDPIQLKPQSAMEFAQRGWLFFGKQQFLEAKTDLEMAASLEQNVDYSYGLGLVLRAMGDNVKALAIFEKCLELSSEIVDRQRATMLHRLILGQINMIKSGDWNLEKEVWKRIR